MEAFSAWLEGREDDAARLFRVAAEAGPDDRHVQADAADFFLTRNEPELALPFLRRAVALAPAPGGPLLYLAIALGALGRQEELRELARTLEAGPQVKGALAALTAARVFLGNRKGALVSARAAVAASTDDVERGEAGFFLESLLLVQGDSGRASGIRSSCSTIERAILETARGRWAEARRILALGDLPGCPPLNPARAAKNFYLQPLGADCSPAWATPRPPGPWRSGRRS